MKFFKRNATQPALDQPLINLTGSGLADKLAPAFMDFSIPDCCSFSPTEWMRTWYVRDWPHVISDRQWQRIVNFAGDVRISLFLDPLGFNPRVRTDSLQRRNASRQRRRIASVTDSRTDVFIGRRQFGEPIGDRLAIDSIEFLRDVAAERRWAQGQEHDGCDAIYPVYSTSIVAALFLNWTGTTISLSPAESRTTGWPASPVILMCMMLSMTNPPPSAVTALPR